jgi:hypothetical protein
MLSYRWNGVVLRVGWGMVVSMRDGVGWGMGMDGSVSGGSDRNKSLMLIHIKIRMGVKVT